MFKVVKLPDRCLRRLETRFGISPSFSYWKTKLQSVSLSLFPFKKRMYQQQGLTLIEVLVALAIVGLIFFTADLTVESDREALDRSVESLERMISVSSHEAIWRNAVLRLKISMDKDPQETSLETTLPGDVLLPSFSEKTSEELSLEEQEEEEKKKKTLNQKFQLLPDLEQNPFLFPQTVQLMAVGTFFQKKLISSGEAFLYIFPQGEKDPAILFLKTNQELAILKIDPFMDNMDKEYVMIPQELLDHEEKVQEWIQQKILDSYQTWSKP
jgi:prepilin-type N-terminal cleavage/methylation domain-containing protein